MGLASLRHWGRISELALILVKNGFAEVAERLDLPLPSREEGAASPVEASHQQPVWVRLRLVAEEMGPSFVKLGQIMSQRPDLLPPELILELRKLQDQVSPEPFDAIEKQIDKALGRPWREVFSEMDETPLASASLAQVHRARLLADGREVAVKVRRPGVAKTIHQDLSLLADLAHALSGHLGAVEAYDLVGLVEEIRHSLNQELDFSREARQLVVARSRGGGEVVLIPQPRPELSRPALLVEDLVSGEPLARAALSLEERRRLARQLAGDMMDQMLIRGFFHADPHPGNIMVVRAPEKPPQLALLDWGLAGRLTPEMRYIVGDLFAGLVERDSAAVVEGLINIGMAEEDIDRPRLALEVEEIIETLHATSPERLELGKLVLAVLGLMRRFRLRVQVQYALMNKAMMETEAAARELDPELDLVEVARSRVRRLLLERYRPDVVLKRLGKGLNQAGDLALALPGRLDAILTQMQKGELGLDLKHEGLDRLEDAMESGANRLSVALILAALIVGSSMIITTGVEPTLFGYPVLGVVGYVISAVGGLWLVWSILRSHRGKD